MQPPRPDRLHACTGRVLLITLERLDQKPSEFRSANDQRSLDRTACRIQRIDRPVKGLCRPCSAGSFPGQEPISGRDHRGGNPLRRARMDPGAGFSEPVTHSMAWRLLESSCPSMKRDTSTDRGTKSRSRPGHGMLDRSSDVQGVATHCDCCTYVETV